MTSRLALALALALALVALVLVASVPAEACAVCFQAKSDASRVAFIVTTAAMTFLPLAVVGALAWWVRRQFVKADRESVQSDPRV